MRAFLISLVCLFVVLSATVSRAGPVERRVALVVGNSGYRNFPALPNPRNDADDMITTLKAFGFDVHGGTDLTRQMLRDELRQFARAAQGADAALVFYAGHGLQYRGRNYIVPIDAKLQDEFDLDYETVRVDDVLEELNRADGAKILILDACRNLPLAGKSSREAFSSTGLAKLSGRGLVVAYATQANAVAFDGTGRNSIFTGAFLKAFQEPGLDLPQLFQRVSINVDRQSGGRQTPEVSLSYPGQFFFNRGETDREAWTRVRNSGDSDALRAFIARFPNSFLVDDASEAIQRVDDERRRGGAVVAARDPVPPRPAPGPAPVDPAAAQKAREDAERLAWQALQDEQKRRAEARQRLENDRTSADAADKQRLAAEARKQEDDKRRSDAQAAAEARERQRLADAERQRLAAEQRAAEQARAAEDGRLRKLAEDRARTDALEQKRLADEERKRAADEKARLAEEARQSRLADAQAKAEAAERQRVAEAERKRIADEQRAAEQARAAEEARGRKLAEDQARAEAAERQRVADAEKKRLADEQQARAAEEARGRKLVEDQARAEAAERQRVADAEKKRLADEQQARAAEEARARKLAEDKARTEAAERQRVADAEKKRLADEQQARAAEEARGRKLAEDQARAEAAERQRVADAEKKRLADEQRAAEQVRLADEARARQLADDQARAAAEARRRELADAQAAAEAKAAADRQERARVAAEALRIKEADLAAARERDRLAWLDLEEQQKRRAAAQLDRGPGPADAATAPGAAPGLQGAAPGLQGAAQDVVAANGAGPSDASAETGSNPRTTRLASNDAVQPAIVARNPESNFPQAALGEEALVRATQAELGRIGCYAQDAGGRWTSGAQAALTRFFRQAKLGTVPTKPSGEILDDLKNRPAGFCPLECGRGQVAEGDRCVAVARPKVEPRPTVERKAPRPKAVAQERERPEPRPVVQARPRQAPPQSPVSTAAAGPKPAARPMLGVGF